MVTLYSGTPGSGKSLHMADVIFINLKFGHPVIGNFRFNDELVRFKKTRYVYIPTWELTPQKLIDFSLSYQREHGRIKEGTIKVFIDEAQLMFNSRDYGDKDRREWLSFFTLHRHYGIDIVLACQFDRMLDRQIRCLIEYEFLHRKVSNFGWRGALLNVLMGGNMFCFARLWYPLKEKMGGEFFKFKKKYARCYDTYDISIDKDRSSKGAQSAEDGGEDGNPDRVGAGGPCEGEGAPQALPEVVVVTG